MHITKQIYLNAQEPWYPNRIPHHKSEESLTDHYDTTVVIQNHNRSRIT